MNTVIDVRNKLAKFLTCELDCNSGQFWLAKKEQKLEPMVHQFILLLIAHQGNIVSKQLVLDTLWPNKKPTDVALRALIKKTREALRDDAKNPIYIKTIPTKGYLLIPVVELTSTVMQSWFLQHAKLLMWIIVVMVISISLSSWYFYSISGFSDYEKKVYLTKLSIGNTNRDDVSTYFIGDGLKSLWIEDYESKKSSQIEIIDLATKFKKTIAFPDLISHKYVYSEGSERLLILPKQNKNLYALEFSKQALGISIIDLSIELPANIEINALDYSGNHLFVISSISKQLGLLDLKTGELITPPAIVSIQDELLAASIESQNASKQNGSISVWPSPTSSAFVVSFDFAYKSKLLYYPSELAVKPNSAIDIVGRVQSGIWDKEGQRFSFTDDSAKLFAYQIDEGRLTSFNANGEHINRIVADCGPKCFVVANTHGIVKLSEITNPFNDKKQLMASTQSSPVFAQVIETNTIARNESLPNYTEHGIYFVSQQLGNTELIFRDDHNQEELIYTFSKHATVGELAVDSSASQLAGIVNQRPFVLDVNTKKLNYIPLTFPHVSHISFEDSNIIRFYAETSAVNKHKRGSSSSAQNTTPNANAGQANGLYEYNIDTKQAKLLLSNVKHQRSIDLVDVNDKGSNRYKANLILDNAGIMTIAFQNNKQTTVIGIGKGDCTNCWHVRGNYLYQIKPSIDKNLASVMTRTSLLTGAITEQTLFFRDLLNTFSIHPNTNKIMVTTRRNLHTELTKIDGFEQMY